jgi:aspartate/methionine/tyrosine aminotransferase
MNTTADSLVTLAARVDAIQPFYVMELMKEAQRLESSGRDVIHMGSASRTSPRRSPSSRRPRPRCAAGSRSTRARSALRRCAKRSRRTMRAYGLTISPERIVVTAGASAALLLACLALVGRDDEVLMPDPSYPCNRHFVAAAEGRPVLVPSGPGALPAHRRRRPHALGQPHARRAARVAVEPDRHVARAGRAQRIVEAVRARGGFTIVDEIYQGLSYDAAPVSALSYGDDVVTVNSFSKYFSMTGWRLGWPVVPPALVGTFESCRRICSSVRPRSRSMRRSPASNRRRSTSTKRASNSSVAATSSRRR